MVKEIWEELRFGKLHYLVASTQNATMLEYIPWTLHIFVEPITVRDGFYVLPELPGASM